MHNHVKTSFYLFDLFNIGVFLLLVALVRLHSLLGFVQHCNLAQKQSLREYIGTEDEKFKRFQTTNIVLHDKGVMDRVYLEPCCAFI